MVPSSHCASKGVRAPATAPHICYCHTLMQYIWDQYDQYFGPGRAFWPVRTAIHFLRGRLQKWDAASSRRVSAFAANSGHVAERIRR